MFKVKKLGEAGFTFLNSIFDLMVLLAILPLIILFFSFSISFSKELDPKHLEWQLFTEDLQSYLVEVDSITVIEGGSGIRVNVNGVVYDIEKYGNLIRKQKSNQGHEIMLTNLDACRFSIQGSLLKVSADFSNGVSEQAEYVFTYP